jgi:hypothetical protein
MKLNNYRCGDNVPLKYSTGTTDRNHEEPVRMNNDQNKISTDNIPNTI